MTQADTFDELGEMIEDAMRAWIETALEDGQSIPEPRRDESYSGKFVLRVPRSLHRELAEAAERDNVSLNTFSVTALSKAIGGQVSASANPAPAFTPYWPHLSGAARKAMRTAGLSAEAGQVDERLFANWLDNNLQQLQAALDGGYSQDISARVHQIRQALGQCRHDSPLMGVFYEAIRVLEGQIVQADQLRAGIIKLTTLESRVKTQVQTQSYYVNQDSRRQPVYDPQNDWEMEHSRIVFDTVHEQGSHR
jgi:predicted HicB family RNase H-like nuclease